MGQPAHGFFFWSQATALCALGLACVLWVLVVRNANPLRLKAHLAAAWLLAWAGLTGCASALARLFLG